MKVVILAGGRGSRLAEETRSIPKPMVLIGGRPILWHIMSHYARHGFRDFVIAAGYKGHIIKQYFAEQYRYAADLSVDLATGEVVYLRSTSPDWNVTVIDTGEATMTGGRLRRLSGLLDERFLLTYGDGLSDVDIPAVIAHHEAKAAVATVTAVEPPPRFGSLDLEAGLVTRFAEKPERSRDRINGGYFVVEPDIFPLLDGDSCVLEREPLATLAAEGKLAGYDHRGFWMPMDTLRERDELTRIWASGTAPWSAG